MADEDLTAQLQVAREAFLQDVQETRQFSKVHQQCYRIPSQLLLQGHAERCRAEKANMYPRARKTVVAAGTKHHSASLMNRLEIVTLEKCRLGINNARETGFTKCKALVLRRHKTAKSYRTTGLYILAEDSQGWLVSVLIQNASHQYERLLQPETVFIIKEPWIKPSRDGYIIRVETPTDIYRWPIALSHPENFKSHRTAVEYRRAGSHHFAEGRFAQALDAYQAGIYHWWQSKSEQAELALLNLNAAAAAVKVNLPGLALRQLDAMNLSHLTTVQRTKAFYRRALALYQSERYATAVSVCGWEKTEELNHLLHEARQRIEEQTNGVYDWPNIYRSLQAGRSDIDIAEYIGPVCIGFSAGKGKGLFATQSIEPGQLLLVSKPLASAKPEYSKTDVVLGLNLASNSLDTYTQVSIPGLLAYKSLYDETLPRKLYELYSGPEEEKKSLVTLFPANSWLDTGRTEGVCTYNSFRPVCITHMYQDVPKSGVSLPNDHSDHLHSASALYHMPSFMNHACIGNACYSFFGDIFVLRAIKRIEKGEEILDSYCNAMDPLTQRMEHLSRYGFTCRCSLCGADRADGEDAITRRRFLLDQLSSQRKSASPQTLNEIIQEIRETYQSSPSGPRPDLYTCYRALATAHTDRDDVLEAELKALEALGVCFTLPRPAKVSDQMDLSSTSIPSLGLENAIISYMKIANDSLKAGFPIAARAWIDEARRLHGIVYGPDLFELHMQPFIEAQGWLPLLEI